MKIVSVLWDFDGVLCDSLPQTYQTICKLFDYCGLRRPSYEDYVACFHEPYIEFYRRFGITHPGEEIQRMFNRAEDCKSFSLFQDSVSTLNYLKQHGLRMGIVSARPAYAIEYHCWNAQVYKHFEFIATRFPDKSVPILEYCRNRNISPSSVVYLGDSQSDMRHAKTAGVIAVGVTRGKHSEAELRAAKADYCIANLHQLFPILGIDIPTSLAA